MNQGKPGSQVSGNATRSAPPLAACSISTAALSMEASRFMNTGAACTAAALIAFMGSYISGLSIPDAHRFYSHPRWDRSEFTASHVVLATRLALIVPTRVPEGVDNHGGQRIDDIW